MKLPPREMALLTRRLADLTAGGLTLNRSLEVAGAQSGHAGVRTLVKDLRHELKSGKSFSQALARQNGYFQPVYVGMIRAGESSGDVESALGELARLLDHDIETRRRVRSALAYPIILLAMSVAVCVFLTVFVIPRFEFLFQDLGQRLPLPTRMLIGSTLFFKRVGWIVVPAIGAMIIVARKKYHWRTAVLRRVASLPIIRDAVRDIQLERWTRVMATLLRNGFTVTDALRLSRQTLGHATIFDAVGEALVRVLEGRGLAAALAASPVFPAYLSELVAAGEESGRLEQTFERLSETYRQETEAHMRLALSLLEPALILVMGAVVGFVALAMLLPIFEMSASIR